MDRRIISGPFTLTTKPTLSKKQKPPFLRKWRFLLSLYERKQRFLFRKAVLCVKIGRDIQNLTNKNNV